MGGPREDYGRGLYYKHRPLQLCVVVMRVEGCSGVDGLDIEDPGFAGKVVADPFEAVVAAVDGGPLYHGWPEISDFRWALFFFFLESFLGD